jgi:rRNA maturation protein Nop10
MNPDACPKCGGDLWEDVQTSLRICERCGWGYTPSGRAICPSCVEGDCDWCVSWRTEESCSHECLFQHRYGRPEDVGFITAGDW